MATPADRLTAALIDRYQIVREIGQGGMATVYLAQDVRHDRRVALKVLRPELSAILGGERFLHEIRTTANLQHPHILPLHDSGEADGIVFYVMPFVEGESLRDRLNREKQLPIEDAIRIAREVAEALDYAHRHGVVHRDIKPENILLHDGRAQVADFGIALAVSSAGGGTRMTETGMSLGTPHYMSPEQAMGEREISAKSDIYALGCVLYEMLVGEPPFTGPTAQAIIARVVTEEPRSLTIQRRSIPPHIEAVVRKALEKLPADRFANAAQLAAALSNPDLLVLPAPSPNRAAAQRGRGRFPVLPGGARAAVVALGALLVLTTGAAAWGWLHERPLAPATVARFRLPLPAEGRFVDAPGVSIAVSPDGFRLVYVGIDEAGQRSLFLRPMSQLEPVAIPGTRDGSNPLFSPDGAWLAFYSSGGRMQKVALAGGPALTIFTADSGFYGASWGPTDIIVFTDDGGVKSVPAAGGRPTVVAPIDTSQDFGYGWPHVLPDGKAALIQVRGKDQVDRLGVITLASGAIKRFDQNGTNPRYVHTGHVLLGNTGGTIMAVPFDTRRLEVAGAAIPVVEGVPVGQFGAAELGSSSRGTLVYATGSGSLQSVVVVDRQGVAQPVSSEMRMYGSPRVSGDGRRVAVDVLETSTSAIWMLDIDQKTLSRLTFHKFANRPVWTPDGRRIAYTVSDDTPDLYSIRADGSALAESLLVAPGRELADTWTPDGRMLLYHQNNAAVTKNDIMILDSARTTRPYLQTPADEFAPAVSPDGRWVAYSSDESGRVEVYVRAFPDPGGKIQISLDGGTEPRWSRDGRELFYRNVDRMMAAAVETRPEFTVRQRTQLFRGTFASNQYHAQYDVTPDGKFIMLQGPQTAIDLVVVLNWFDQLRSASGSGSAAGGGRQ